MRLWLVLAVVLVAAPTRAIAEPTPCGKKFPVSMLVLMDTFVTTSGNDHYGTCTYDGETLKSGKTLVAEFIDGEVILRLKGLGWVGTSASEWARTAKEITCKETDRPGELACFDGDPRWGGIRVRGGFPDRRNRSRKGPVIVGEMEPMPSDPG